MRMRTSCRLLGGKQVAGECVEGGNRVQSTKLGWFRGSVSVGCAVMGLHLCVLWSQGALCAKAHSCVSCCSSSSFLDLITSSGLEGSALTRFIAPPQGGERQISPKNPRPAQGGKERHTRMERCYQSKPALLSGFSTGIDIRERGGRLRPSFHRRGQHEIVTPLGTFAFDARSWYACTSAHSCVGACPSRVDAHGSQREGGDPGRAFVENASIEGSALEEKRRARPWGRGGSRFDPACSGRGCG